MITNMKKITSTTTIISAIILGALLSACNRSESSTMPPRGPVEPPLSQEQLLLGRQQYSARCAYCHGEDGGGVAIYVGSYPAANLKDGIWFHGGARADLIRTISKGVSGSPMGGFEGIMTRQEIEAAAGYAQELARK